MTANLSVSVDSTSPVTRTLRVEVPAERVAQTRGAVVQEIRSQARVPGFRPGKAPTPVIERNYREHIEQTLLERLMRETIGEAIAQVEGRVLGVRNVTPEPMLAAAPFRYQALVEVPPPVKLAKYAKLKVERPVAEVTPDEVDKVLANLRERQAHFHEAPAGTAAGIGDRVTLDYTATVNGRVLEDGEVRGYRAVLGQGALHEAFEAKLVGLKAGESLQFTLEFGDDAPRDDLRGQQVEFAVTVHAVEQRHLPEMDDAWAATVLPGATLADLRERIAGDMAEARKQEAQRAVEAQVAEALLAAHADLELPPGVVQDRQYRLAEELAQNLQHQGLTQQQIRSMVPQILAEVAPRAEREVRLGFVLAAIAEAESIVVDDDAVREELARVAAARGEPAPAFVARLEQDRSTFERIRAELVKRRALEAVVAQAVVKDVSLEEYRKKRAVEGASAE